VAICHEMHGGSRSYSYVLFHFLRRRENSKSCQGPPNSQAIRCLPSLYQQLDTNYCWVHTNYAPRMVHKFVVVSATQTLHFEQNFTKLNYLKAETLNEERGWFGGPKQVTLLSRMEY
jgi:hypothetical protein